MQKRPRGGGGFVGRSWCGLWLGLPGFVALLVIAWPLAGNAGADSCPNAQFRSGPSEHLPDCRAYEQVSPTTGKGGVDAVTLQPVYPAQASTCETGEACGVVYMNDVAAFGGAQGNELPNAYLARREGGGWQTTSLTPPTLGPPANAGAKVSYAFSPDLTTTILRVPLQQLVDGAPAGVFNLYLRNPGGEYALITALAPTEPPEAGCGGCFLTEDVPTFVGASSDFRHVLFEANDSLVAGAPGKGVNNLYETVGGEVRLVGILPDGSIPPEGAEVGGGVVSSSTQRIGKLERAISEDGSRVLFQARSDGGVAGEQTGQLELYDRHERSSTIEVSAPTPGAEPSRCETTGHLCKPEAAQFWTASTDGSVVYFTSKESLTKESFTGPEIEGSTNPGNDLYRFDVATHMLTDLSVDHQDTNGADVLGVVGSSTDGSYVYFVADGKLAAHAEAGQPNLYVWHGSPESQGEVTFIATLAPPSPEEQGEEENERKFTFQSDIGDWAEHPRESQAYVTPDGRHLAFMSVMPLTGYSNLDQSTGKPDHEVFEYGVETGLRCASCDPSGAPPLGSAFIGATLDERTSTPLHQPRTLSDDGSRAFFSSPDPLVTGLGGGTVKVFEYENGGIHLISASGDEGADVFLDASSSGDDIFFASREQLVPGDTDNLVDVYDARVDGGLPATSSVTSTCQTGGCSAAAAPTFPPPLSSLYAGPGNQPAAVKPSRTRRLADALARCRKLRNRHKRAACARVARRRYQRSKPRPAHHLTVPRHRKRKS